MPLHNIQADVLPGRDDVPAFAAIQAALEHRYSADTPFLMFPVRLETRFMRVERPVLDDHAPGLVLERLEQWTSRLEAVAAMKLETRFGEGTHKKLVKRHEARLCEALENAIPPRAVEDARALVRELEHSSTFDVARARGLDEILVRIGPALMGAKRAVARMRSPWTRRKYGGRVDDLGRAGVAESARKLSRRNDLASRLRLPSRKAPKVIRVDAATLDRTAAARDRIAEILSALSVERPARLVRARGERLGDDADAILAATAEIERVASLIAVLPNEDRASLISRVGELEKSLAPHLPILETGGRPGVIGAVIRIRRILEKLPTDLTVGEHDGPVLVLDRKTRLQDELWVRIYPDDISIDTHEPELTADEVAAGETFWIETISANGDEGLERGAFRALAARSGARRAAWIARIMRPAQRRRLRDLSRFLSALRTTDRRLSSAVALASPRTRFVRIQRAFRAAEVALERSAGVTATQLEAARELLSTVRVKIERFRRGAPLVERATVSSILRFRDALVRFEERVGQLPILGKVELAATLEFPSVETKAAAWTRAPRAPLFPERFVIVAVRNDDSVAHLVTGARIVDLKVGVDPSEAAGQAEQFRLDAEGELIVGESIRWMVDFDTAVARGVAVTIPISHYEAETGFKRLFAVGIRGLDAGAAQAAVEQLLLAHRYGETGLGFLPVGTPTNNTEEGPSAYSGRDDADAVFDLEQADAGRAGADPESDAASFARALGIRASVVDRLQNAGSRDAFDSALVNRTLWPATGGAFLEEMLATLFSLDSIDRIGAFFEQHVSGRSAVPAIRIGPQPYGVLVTTAYSRFVPSTGREPPPMPTGGTSAMTPDQLEQRFHAVLNRVLAQMADDWKRIASKVKHAHSDGVTDGQAHFLEMLGLHPSSVDRQHRFLLNCARHRPGVGSSDLRFGLLPSEGPYALLERFEAVFRSAFTRPGAGMKGSDGRIVPALGDLFNLLTGSRAFGVRLMEGAHALDGDLIPRDPARQLGDILSRDLATLARQAAVGQTVARSSLLELLARSARLHRALDVALRIMEREQMMTAEIRRSVGSADSYLTSDLVTSTAITRWSYLFEVPAEVYGIFGLDFPLGPLGLYGHLNSQVPPPTMAEFISRDSLFQAFAGHAAHDTERARLTSFDTDLAAVAALPRDRLERAVAEHLDLVGHRVDAWRTGLARMRLTELRSVAATGLYAGAYGWLDEVRPGGPRTLSSAVPDALQRPGLATYDDGDDNKGFILTPSPSHAVTAAILRSGYLSENARPDLDNRMAVNLSSRRVRSARMLLDAVRSGIDPGVALGYRFERSLHDAYDREGVTLDALIAPFRQRFATVGAVDPASDDPARAQRQVIDGLELLNTVRANASLAQGASTLFDALEDGGAFGGYPWGLRDDQGVSLLPARGTPELRALLHAIDDLADALDALGDLAVAEGVFQVARGNFERAGAVMAASAEGRAIPEPEIVRTPRTGRTVAHRIALAVPAVDGRPLCFGSADLLNARNAARPAGWTHGVLGARAAAAPSINAWLASILGPASEIAAIVDEAGGAREVTASDLGLQPIDLLALFAGGVEEGLAHLAERIAFFARPDGVPPGDEPTMSLRLRTRAPGWSVDRKTFFEIAPLLSAVHALAGEARPLDATDLHDAHAADPGRAISPFDVAELRTCAEAALGELESLLTALAEVFLPGATSADVLPDPSAFLTANAGAFAGAPDLIWAARAALFGLLARAAERGTSGMIPPARYDDVSDAARQIRTRIEQAVVEVALRVTRARSSVAISAWADVLRAVFGKSFVVLPRFLVAEAQESADALALNALAARNASALAMQSWFFGVAAVRQRPRLLERAYLLADAFGRPLAPPRAIQLPRKPDEEWLGGVLGPEGGPDGDRASIAVFGASELAGTHGAGWVVDEWTEVVPDRVQSTAVAFHYDAPDARAPQALLLVVPPARVTSWRFEDLLLALDETLDLARSRLVENEHLSDEVYGQLLPALAGEVVPRTVSEESDDVGGRRVILDFGVNRRPARP